jgi:LSD1 subclass zinc finger protein
MFWRKKPDRAKNAVQPVHRCTFCNKAQHDVRKLIAAPTVFICDECVQVCNDILADDARFEKRAAEQILETKKEIPDGRATDDPLQWPADANVIRCALCRMPTPVVDAVAIESRGVVCPGCVDAVEAAAAARRQIG